MQPASPSRGFRGVEQVLRTFSGARVVRVIHPPQQEIHEHRHDWPFLMLVGLGDFRECHEDGEARVAGPSAVLHPAGVCHANQIGEHGMETVSIEFQPDWLRSAGFDLALERSRAWLGGGVPVAARALSATFRNESATELEVSRATGAFLRAAMASKGEAEPGWLSDVVTMLDDVRPPSTVEIARRIRLCPAWLARAYLRSTGEGLHQTVRRKRVEKAMLLLRATDAPAAEIATTVGFCDQSHMNRAFRAFAGRTPLEVRAERVVLAGLAPCAAGIYGAPQASG